MEVWFGYTHGLETMIGFLSTQFGLSEALTIIIFTFIARTVLLPISLTAAYKLQKNKVAIARIKPAHEELKIKFKDNPSELASKTMALYREQGIKFVDKVSMLHFVSQAIFGIGIFQTLKKMIFSTKFLWIANLAKPDFLLTTLIGVLMLLGMAILPGATFDTSTLFIFIIPVAFSMIAVAALPSALGIYWATSNAFTILQTFLLRGLLAKRRNLVVGGGA